MTSRGCHCERSEQSLLPDIAGLDQIKLLANLDLFVPFVEEHEQPDFMGVIGPS